MMRALTRSLPVALACLLLSLPATLLADEFWPTVGKGVGVTAGNVVFLPAKVGSVGIGLMAGLFSFIVTGGDTEVATQIWQNSTLDPYLITLSVARMSVGRRPELETPPHIVDTPAPPEKADPVTP